MKRPRKKRLRVIEVLRRELPGEWRYDHDSYRWHRSDGSEVFPEAVMGWSDDDFSTRWVLQKPDGERETLYIGLR